MLECRGRVEVTDLTVTELQEHIENLQPTQERIIAAIEEAALILRRG